MLDGEEKTKIFLVACTASLWPISRRRAADRKPSVPRYLLQADALAVENEQQVFQVAMALRGGSGSFADALIGALGTKAGCERTLTFDKAALGLPGFAPANR